MDNVQIALSLLTVATSGVVAGIVTFRLNASRDARRMRREKLERLFLAHTAFLRQLDVHWVPYLAVMAGHIAYNDALDMTLSHDTTEEKHFEHVEMLVTLYFPELESGVQQLTQIRDEAATIIGAHKREYKRVGPHPTPALEALKRVADRLDEHRSAFRANMAKIARALGAPSKYAA